MFNFFNKKTKWIVLTTYNEGAYDFIVFVRKDTKTGMLEFKTKRVTPAFKNSYNFNKCSVFDINESFRIILSL